MDRGAPGHHGRVHHPRASQAAANARALRDEGVVPYQVDHPEVYRQRSGEAVLPREQDWWDAYTAMRERFNKEPALAVTATANRPFDATAAVANATKSVRPSTAQDAIRSVASAS
jgi:hypothetical protein